MRLVHPHPQIYLFLGDSPAGLGKPFMRLQEFYESPSKKFRRRLFTVKDFKSWYRKSQSANGRFDYYTQYNGYNAPGHVVDHFFSLYADSLTSEEIGMLRMLGPTPNRFYVIGAPAKSAVTVDHEIGHALFYLFEDYADQMRALMVGHDLDDIRRYLKHRMYAEDMIVDEQVSYLMFDEGILHAAGIATRHLRSLRDGMREVYGAYKARYIKL